MHTTTPHLHHLLEAFERHQQLRRSGAPIAMLSESRARLDRLRVDVRRSARS
jgi:hypothetical protein